MADGALDGGQRALVGDAEPPHRVNFVAKELDTDRVVVGGREDIDDAATDSKFAAVRDHVNACVGRVGQCLDERGEGDLLPHFHPHRHQLAQASH